MVFAEKNHSASMIRQDMLGSRESRTFSAGQAWAPVVTKLFTQVSFGVSTFFWNPTMVLNRSPWSQAYFSPVAVRHPQFVACALVKYDLPASAERVVRKLEETSRELRNVGGSDWGRFCGFSNPVGATVIP